MRYLVTGADGFLGKHICQYLQIKNILYRATARCARNNTQFETGDLSEFKNWPALFENIDTVIHAAAKAHDMSNAAELENVFYKINFKMTENLAKQAKLNKIKKFLFISTIKVNGEFTTSKPFMADDLANPSDDYAKSKYLAEQALMKLHEPGVFDVIIIRPCLIYGAGVKGNFNSLAQLIQKKIPLPFGSVNNKRSVVSTDNLISLIMNCLENSAGHGQIFLASDRADLSLTELIKSIALASRTKVILLPIPVFILKLILKLSGKNDLAQRLFLNLQVNTDKNYDLLKWEPEFSTEACLKKMIT